MKIKRFLETHPVFRYDEFSAFMAAAGTSQPEGWRQLLNYHQKAGHLIHIRKFLYAVKPMISQEHWIDPYLIASRATADAIIAYHTALELHGIAYTTFNEFTFLSNRQAASFDYEGQRFRAIIQPKGLINKAQTKYGTDVIQRGGLSIQLTSLERTIVDMLDRPDLGGGWEEIWRSLDNITQLNTARLVEYALLLNNATTIAKVGYFLEQRPSHFTLEKTYLEKLIARVPKQPHYMSRELGEGKYIDKWQLIVPLAIINRTWEEPDVENI
jgi:predicted transcriptional regulator of viral defense system